jgi:hypothetical protein
MKPNQPPGPPPTLGDVRWLGARSLVAVCHSCGHLDVFDVAALPDSMPLSWVASRFVCKRCNHPGAYVLPNWTDPAPTSSPPPEEPADDQGSEPLA